MDPGADCAGVCGCTESTPAPASQHTEGHPPQVKPHPQSPARPQDYDEDQDDLQPSSKKSKVSKASKLSDQDEDESSDVDEDESAVDHSQCSHAAPTPAPKQSKKPKKKQSTIKGMAIVDQCQEKCADMCPEGGVCMKECYVHFCGVEEEGSQQRRVLLLCAIAMTAMFGFWLVRRIKRKPSFPRIDERPFISLRMPPSEI